MPELRCDCEPGIAAERLAFVEEALRTSFRITGFRAGAGFVAIEHDALETGEAIREMVRRFLFISRNINKDLVFDNPAPMAFGADPQPALLAARELLPVQPGFCSFQGGFLRVLKAIDRMTLALAARVGAIEQEHPAVWPVRLFKMIDYFHEFPQQMILCAPVKGDFAARSNFSKRFGRSQDFDSVPMGELMEDSSYGLQPAVCDCCYYTLEGSRAHHDSFYTTANKVFRNERSPTGGLERLTNFTVRDIMFVGSEGFVLEARERLIEMLADMLRALQLNARIETANDPFFANDSAMKSVFQNAHRLKYELLATIPHLDRSIAVGSINLHKDFFGKAFDIQLAGGGAAQSGCIGVGFERLAFALHCQHGPELERWPPGVLEHLGLRT